MPRLLLLPRRPLAALLALLLASSASAGAALAAAGGIGDLYITSDASDQVRAYGGASGVFLGQHVVSVNGSGELGITFGLNGRMLVGHISGGVDEYDATTGAFIKTYSPGNTWQWTAVFAPNGNVYIGSQATNDIREYDSTTGAYVQTLCSFFAPGDMAYGPNGNLYVCSYFGGFVAELDPTNGNPLSQWSQPSGSLTNDIAFLPGGRFVVTTMGTSKAYVYDAAQNLLTFFAGTGWVNPHGVAISPYTGNILIVDGVTTQVHEFDPNTYAELDATFLVPNPGDKIVDLAFRPDLAGVPAAPSTWGRIKAQWR